MTQKIIVWWRKDMKKKILVKTNKTAQSPEVDCMSLTLPFKRKSFLS